MTASWIRRPYAGPLPPAGLRMGGEHFQDDEAFVATAARDVARLEARAGLSAESSLLDWGCGAGRLAVGVKARLGAVREYHGVDVQPALIEWDRAHLADPATHFTLVDVANARYNPGGERAAVIPATDRSVDVFYAYSVWSHLDAADAAAYLRELARVLAPSGAAMLTCFVEDDVPAWQENPAGYGPLAWEGALHCARFERRFFESLIAAAGLAVVRFEYGGETDGQSLYVVRRSAGAAASAAATR